MIELSAVVFDMDGLMIETESLYKKAWQQAARELGHEIADDFYLTFVGRKSEECEAILVERFGGGFSLPEFRTRWSHAWRAEAETCGIATKPGLMELLAFLEERGIPAAVATSSDERFTSFSLRITGLSGRFASVITGDTVERGKPAPDIYLAAARRLGVAPERSIALEDSDAGVLAASRAGMVTLMVPDLKPPSPQASAAAFRVLGSLDEARQVIDTLLTGLRSRE